MTVVEIYFATSGVAPRNDDYEDGMPVQVSGSGMLLSPTQITTWFQNGTVPSIVNNLEPSDRYRHKRYILQTKYLAANGRTKEEAATARWGAKYTGAVPGAKLSMEQEAQMNIDQAVTDAINIKQYGYDTNWTHEQLMEGGVLMATIPHEYVEDFVQGDTDEANDPIGKRFKRKKRQYRIPYEEYVSAALKAKLQNHSIRVEAKRNQTPLTLSQIKRIVEAI